MAKATRKRRATNPTDGSKRSKKRLKTLQPPDNKIHPFTQLPSELQLRIMGLCDRRTLAAFSLLSNHFRELALRIMWETEPVETSIQNFDQLDEHEDLRLAVRHLAVTRKSAPNKSRFSGVRTRLLSRFPQNYFPGLIKFTIKYQIITSDYFVNIMKGLARYQPKRLKTLNIELGYSWSRLNPTLEDERQRRIVYPTGLTTINVKCSFSGRYLAFDPLKVFDFNASTVTTATVDLPHWCERFSLRPCPKVTTLFTKHNGPEECLAKELSIKFPNTEHLDLEMLQLLDTAQTAMMDRYTDWRLFSSVKSVKLTYSSWFRVSNDVTFRNHVLDNIEYMAGKWISDGHMPALEKIDAWAHFYGNANANEVQHSFTLSVDIKDGQRVVTVDTITKLPGSY